MNGAGRGVEGHPTHRVDRPLSVVGRLDLEQRDFAADSLERADADRNDVDAVVDLCANGCRDEELIAFGGGGDACGEVDGGAVVVALSVQDRPAVCADAHAREVRLFLGPTARVDAERDCGHRRREGDHELVTDLFDDLSVALGSYLADDVGEATDHGGGCAVAHGFGEGRVAGQVDEQHGADELAGRGRLLHEVQEQVFPVGAFPALAVEIEHGRFDELGERVGDRLGGGHQLRAAQSLAAELLVDVEVEGAGRGVGDAVE
jgi:hypothetical protein